MADGDSGIEGEINDAPQENGDEKPAAPEETEREEEEDEEEDEDRPVVELFVKAAVDKMKNGSCPICQRYFMIFYILREHGLIDLVVTTFMPENPPREVLEFANGKRYPLVKVHKGVSKAGRQLAGPYDTTDEIDDLVKSFRAKCMATRNEDVDAMEAESRFDDLYAKFNAFLKDEKAPPTSLNRILVKVNDHLRSNETRFMVADELRRPDCHLLPWLQHIRVAGKAFKDFEIPTELTYLWRYLSNAYETAAFKESCPADREIISHYQEKLRYAANKKAQLMKDTRTFSVPDAGLDNGVQHD